MLQIEETLHFKTFHMGIRVNIPSITKNRISILNSWSAIEEIIRYLHTHEESHQVKVLHDQLRAMRAEGGSRKIYSPEDLVRAFSYYALSRSSYQKMRNDFKMPSISTLSNITSSCNKQTSSMFLQNVIGSIEDSKRACVLLHDEVYIKKSMLYHGGEIFGRATNDPTLLAETMLGQMLVCLHGGPTFIVKMLPVAKLNANFLAEQLNKTVEEIENSNGRLKAIICDGNRTNQACFRKFKTIEGKPWLSVQETFFLFDFVHLLKNIRNLWITEVSSQLIFEDNGQKYVANFFHIRDLYSWEKKDRVKMSELDEVSVYPKPIQ